MGAPDDRTKRLALGAAIMGSFVAGLDATAVNVALPSIRADLGGGLAGQQWVSNAYLLMLGSLILVGGSLGDLYGERRIFTLGVAGFGTASLLCALAPSIELLVLGRALQGVFGALLTPSALAVIVATFPAAERGGAIGSWTAWAGIATVIGPLAGGWLVDAVSWRLIFAINVPFVAITLALIAVAIPRREGDGGPVHVDAPGAALTALGLAGPVLALIRQPAVGWSSPEVWGAGLGGVALLAAFLVREGRTAHPMLPLGLFARQNFAVGNVQTFAMYGGLGVTFFFLVLFLQQVAGYQALQAGFATMPTTIVMFLLSKRAGRLADRFGPRLFMGGGPLVAAAGMALMLRLDAHLSYWTDLFPALVVFSLGLAATVAPLTATVLADADEENAGIASGINNAVARVAGLLAVAGLGAVVAAQFGGRLDRDAVGAATTPAARAALAQARRETLSRVDPAVAGPRVAAAVQDASVHAFHVGVGIAAALVALGGLLGLAGIRNPRREVRCEECAGGQFAGAPADAAPHVHVPAPVPVGAVTAPEP
ncbi:DHA2 family efflux MFS transporter permease subunit [Paraconexibacter antarcticus]|uniref:DHA2 family efflux MFS transporter permease subunit n=1 Tax=Paraconexibacter antarcticus TaxID=2949664 RepID=A0ABY5DVJ4_9ACTN|nr:DHA2 family efflux MFS transporter permease subunit [Paraconexibacter antarcticus]UTI64949.1 DHA2 family efflux MFS transporter permease subunit [Paraconexibacter antarcticus]